MTRTTTVLAGVAACALAIVVAAPADAALLAHQKFSFTDSGTFDDCGMRGLTDDVVGSGITEVRTVQGTDQAFKGWVNIQVTDTIRNPANARWFTIENHSLLRDVSAVHVEGNVYRFEGKQSGQPFTVTDDQGNVVHRESGTIRTEQLFDTLGDGQPGGIVIEETLVDLNGHFVFADWCTDLLVPLLS